MSIEKAAADQAERERLKGEVDYDLGKLGYEAYGDEADWKNFQGNPMPKWDELPPNIQRYWIAAASQIANAAAGSCR